jgi:hypothetical protein
MKSGSEIQILKSSHPEILKSPLPLFVLLIRTDHPHHAAAADDLAFVTNPSDRCPDLHELPHRDLRIWGFEDLRI